MNSRDKLYVAYKKLVDKKNNDDKRLNKLNEELETHKNNQKDIENDIRQNNDAEIEKISSQIQDLKKRISDIQEKKEDTSGEFDSDLAISEIEKQLNEELEKELSKYNSEKNDLLIQIQNNYKDISKQVSDEKDFYLGNENVASLVKYLESHKGILPEPLNRNLTNEEVVNVTNSVKGAKEHKRNKLASLPISGGESARNDVVFGVIIPLALISIVLWFVVFKLGFVAAIFKGITGAVVIGAQMLLNVILAFVAGALIGAVVGVAITIFTGLWQAIVVLGVIGGIIGVVKEGVGSGASNLSGNAQNVVGLVGCWIVFLILFVIALCILIAERESVASFIEGLPFIKKLVTSNDAKIYKANENWYLFAMNLYRCIEVEKKEQIDKTIQDKKLALDKVTTTIKNIKNEFNNKKNERIAKYLESQKADYDKKIQNKDAFNKDLNKQIEDINIQIRKKEEEISNRKSNLGKIIDDAVKEATRKENELRKDIGAVEKKIKEDIVEIENSAKGIIEKSVIDIEESHGCISEQIFYEQKSKDNEYTELFPINHSFKPILLLYKGNNISDEKKLKALYPIVDNMCKEFLNNNSIETIEFDIMDPCNGGVDIKDSAFYTMYPNKEHKESDFYDKIDKLIHYVAEYNEGDTWNDMIKHRYDTTRNVSDVKIQIGAIVIPPSELSETHFDENMWRIVRSGKERGFIPVFFVNEDDYKNFDETKTSKSKDVLEQLHKEFDDSKNTFYIDLSSGRIA